MEGAVVVTVDEHDVDVCSRQGLTCGQTTESCTGHNDTTIGDLFLMP